MIGAVPKTIGTPSDQHKSAMPLWKKCRAVLAGERYVKQHDKQLDLVTFNNLLVPFSTKMSPSQYQFYLAEAEFPNIVAQYARVLAGGLLRKEPLLTLPDSLPDEVRDWLRDDICQDGTPLLNLLAQAVRETLATNRGWVFIDHPYVPEGQEGKFKPYPYIRTAEEVIKDHYSIDHSGRKVLSSLVVKTYEEIVDKVTYSRELRETCILHALDDAGFYFVQRYTTASTLAEEPATAGRVQKPAEVSSEMMFTKDGPPVYPLMNGNKLTFIPAWPLTGNDDEYADPLLLPLVEKEIHLYNKMSRRNHLMYGAATYTPWIATSMQNEDFGKLVDAGLGSWLKLDPEDKIGVLEAPTQALESMEAAIAACIEEMARLGVRILSPETQQSGVALNIRNAAQTAQIGSMNQQLTSTIRQVMAVLVEWRYKIKISPSDIKLSMAEDFADAPTGADWLRLATEWYQDGLIDRDTWIILLKANKMVPAEYDDKEGLSRIASDPVLLPKTPGPAEPEL